MQIKITTIDKIKYSDMNKHYK